MFVEMVTAIVEDAEVQRKRPLCERRMVWSKGTQPQRETANSDISNHQFVVHREGEAISSGTQERSYAVHRRNASP